MINTFLSFALMYALSFITLVLVINDVIVINPLVNVMDSLKFLPTTQGKKYPNQGIFQGKMA